MNIVDAFFVEIGLDQTKFDLNRKEATSSMDWLKDGLDADAAAINATVAKSVSDSMRAVERHFLAFFAALLGARSIRDFIASTTRMEVQLSILASALGVPVANLSAFEMAVERAGGTAEGAAASLSNFNRLVFAYNVEGQVAPDAFYRMGGAAIDPYANRLEQLLQLSDILAKYQTDVATKRFLLSQLGIDDATAQLITQPGKIRALVADAQRDAVTPGQAAGGVQSNRAWVELRQSVQGVGRQMLEAVQGPMTDLLGRLRSWLEANKEWITGWFSDKAHQFSTWVDGLDWAKVGQVLRDVAASVGRIAAAIGGWQAVTVGFVGIWASLEIAPLMQVGLSLAQMASPLGNVLVALTAVLAAYQLLPGHAAAGNLVHVRGRDGRPTTSASPMSPTTPPSGGPATKPGGTAGGRSQGGGYTPTWLDPGSLGGILAPATETSEGPIGPGRPVPVTVETAPEREDTFWGYIGKAFGVLGRGLERVLSGASGPATKGEGIGTAVAQPSAPGTFRSVYPLSDKDLSSAVVNTVAGEASTNDPGAIDAVINNAFNRLGSKGYGPSGNLEEVFRAPGQYTGWRVANPTEATFIRSRIKAIASGGMPDTTKGSMEYRGAGLYEEFKRRHPEGAGIGGNWFFRTPTPIGPYKAYDHPRMEPPPSTIPFVAPKPAADDAASSAKTSMLHRRYEVARIDVHAHSARGDGVAREVRLALEYELGRVSIA